MLFRSTVDGPDSEHVCAFLRRGSDTCMLVAAALLPRRLEEHGLSPDTILQVPHDGHRGTWRDLLSGRTTDIRHGEVASANLFARLPVAVLVNE